MPDPRAPQPDPRPILRNLILARNAPATLALARESGMPRAQFEAFLREVVEEQKSSGKEERLGPRYEIATGQYTTLDEWAKRVLKSR